MISTFWTNTIWYILIGILTLCELFFVIYKAKKRGPTFAFYLTILGIVLYFESAILVFLKAYTYYPKIFKNPPLQFDDVLAGNLFSQFSVSATGLLITILNLKYYWFFIFSVIYGIIEEFFLDLGIYSHNWYKTWMTITLLPLYFWIIKKMYAKIIRGIKPMLYYGYVFLGLFFLNIVIMTWGLMLLRLQEFSWIVLTDPISSRHLLVLILFFLLSIPIMLIYFLKPKWIWKSLVILLLYIVYYIGYKLNLILIKDGWFLLVSTTTIFWLYLSVFILDRLYGGLNNNSMYMEE